MVSVVCMAVFVDLDGYRLHLSGGIVVVINYPTGESKKVIEHR